MSTSFPASPALTHTGPTHTVSFMTTRSFIEKGASTTLRIGRTTNHPSRGDESVRQTVRPSAAFRLAQGTALTPPASVSHARGDIPAALVGRGAADGRTHLLNGLR
jgi:hypothetical protein